MRPQPRLLTLASALLCACVLVTCTQGPEASASRGDEERAQSDRGAPDAEVVLADAVTKAARVLQVFVHVESDEPGSGPWVWPLPSPHVLVRPFDLPAQRWLPGHRGVDLDGPRGSPVRAVADGQVRFAGMVAGVGVVSVSHPDGLVSTYQPVRVGVRKGEAVVRGQRIGALEERGGHCAPSTCLHLGARRGGDYLDPMMLLRAWEASLLPQR